MPRSISSVQWRGRLLTVARRAVSRVAPKVVSKVVSKAVQELVRNPARPVARRAVGRAALISRVAAVAEVVRLRSPIQLVEVVRLRSPIQLGEVVRLRSPIQLAEVVRLRSPIQVAEVARLRSPIQVAEVLAAGLPHRRGLLLLVRHQAAQLLARANQPRPSCSSLSASRRVSLPCRPRGGHHVA